MMSLQRTRRILFLVFIRVDLGDHGTPLLCQKYCVPTALPRASPYGPGNSVKPTFFQSNKK